MDRKMELLKKEKDSEVAALKRHLEVRTFLRIKYLSQKLLGNVNLRSSL
jgi:hypothetical protein